MPPGRRGIALAADTGDDAGVKPLARAAVAVAAGIASAVYQQAANAAGRRRFPPPGQLADVGGRGIHVVAMGEGTPAVVIVPSLGGNALEWVRVQRAAATKTTVVVDRAGNGGALCERA